MGKLTENDERRELEVKRFIYEKRMSTANIIATITLMVVLLGWGVGVNSSQAVTDTEIANIKDRMVQTRAETLETLRAIDRKLDRALAGIRK